MSLPERSRSYAVVRHAARMFSWYFRGFRATWAILVALLGTHGLFRLLRSAASDETITLVFILQSDWLERGGLQWSALLLNGFAVFSLEGLVMTMVLVAATMPWLEKRFGGVVAFGLILGLAWTLGPLKILLGASGAVGPSKFTLMLQTFWWLDHPVLLWLAGKMLSRTRSLGANLAATATRSAGWGVGLWLGWTSFFGDNPAHTVSVAAGIVLAILGLGRTPSWETAYATSSCGPEV